MKGNVIAGCDEAGRGCIIGPLVVAGVSVTPEEEEKLKRIGVKDSKELPHHKREELAEKIATSQDNLKNIAERKDYDISPFFSLSTL